MSEKHLIIASGGTGGHFYPTMAIAKAFVAMGNRATVLVAGPHAQEQRKIAEDNGLVAVEVPAVRGPSGLLSLLMFPFRMRSCIRKSRKVLASLKPDVMVGMGSYASVPPCWAKPDNVPLLLHEGNAFMGKANRWLRGKAMAIGLALPLADQGQLNGVRGEIVGMPLRKALIDAAASGEKYVEYLPSLGLANGVPTVLVFGGSQGARYINGLLPQAVQLLGDRTSQLQIIHLTGTDDNGELVEAYRKAGVKASVRRAESAIEKCYANADLVICRGGASTLCELALFGKPGIIIPLPTATDDHQSLNAKLAEKVGGAIHLPQHEASPEKLSEYLLNFVADRMQFVDMGAKLQVLAKPDAAESMARLAAEYAESGAK